MQIHILTFDDYIERASVDAKKMVELADALNGGRDVFGPYDVISVELEDMPPNQRHALGRRRSGHYYSKRQNVG